MEEKILLILNDVWSWAKTPTQAKEELLGVYEEMAEHPPKLEHLIFMDDIICQGDWLHKYTKQRYYGVELINKYGYTGNDLIKLMDKYECTGDVYHNNLKDSIEWKR